MKAVVVHPTVNAFVRALVERLEAEGRLAEFHTTLAVGRRGVAVARGRVRQHPWREIVRWLAGRAGWRGPVRHEVGWASLDAVYRAVSEAAAARVRGGIECGAVYAYEDGALEVFEAASERGLARWYELPIAYWETARRLLEGEARRWPSWEPTLVGTRDSAAKCARKTAEAAAADAIVCPSEFVRRTLPEGLRGRAVVAEYGCPAPEPPGVRRENDRLRILFAGAMTQRKGLADLFAAMKLLGRRDVELVVMGAPLMPMEFYRAEYGGFTHEAPRARGRVLELMGGCDVLALPSVVEGRALVQGEALSRGLPLVVTPNAGGEDLVVEGRTGFLVGVGDVRGLADRIGWFADHREALPAMGVACREMAAARGWERFAGDVAGRMR